ncbi:MAG: hypothetical protein IJH20_00760 [Bacilli bacterium]|nr:hypothetical protein [Bacilli bacterium]
MIKPNNLYEATKLPANEELLNALLSKYFSIAYKDMSNGFAELNKLLYKKINIYSTNSGDVINKQDLGQLINEINQDFINAGLPYNPSEHNGVRNPLAVMPGWNTFKSWHLLGTERISSNDISHRFYFGIPNSKLYEFANVLYDKLKSANIPFYFKTDINNNIQRTDNLVLYTSTSLLEQTMNVIEQVKQERPDLLSQCSEPSVLAGKYDSKIGYASEDTNANTSYTNLMCESFILSIENCLRTYTHTNPSPQIKMVYQQKIQEYIRSGKSVELDNIKNRILLDILINNDSTFKHSLLAEFRKELSSKGIDIENVCFNKKVKEEVDQTYGSMEIENTITLPNGQTLTQQEYLEKNNVLYWVPPTCMVTLKNGKVLTGEEFVKGVLSRANQFNSFQELFLFYGAKVERNISQENSELNPTEPKQTGMYR